MNRDNRLIVGSRKSDLALWQAAFVKNEIEKSNRHVEVVIEKIETTGDKILDVALSKIGDKGLFTKELEAALLNGQIDLAVHSLKDLETEMPAGLELCAVTKRHSVEDVLIAREPGTTIEQLPDGATVATGALRRRSQLKNLRPDIHIADIRGNVPTRIQKFLDSSWDALILARAGVERLKMNRHISSVIDIGKMLPAVGQGALGLQIKAGNRFAADTVQSLHDEKTYLAVTAERSLLKTLQGGCQVPIGAYGEVRPDGLYLSAMVGSIEGDVTWRMNIRGEKTEAIKFGETLANNLLNAGARDILNDIYLQRRPGLSG